MVYRSPSGHQDASDEFAALRTDLAIESGVHESFAATRRAIYCPNPELLARLDDFVENEGEPLIVVGDSGVGKSALLAYWCHNYRFRHPGAFLVAHHAGTNGEGPVRMLRRIMGEIKLRYSVSRDLPSTPELAVNELPFWLAHVHAETLIIVADGIDQLDSTDGFGWLPEFLPANIRLIISSRPCGALDALRGRRWDELMVQPLDDVERAEMAREYLRGRQQTLAHSHLRAATTGSMAGNPLFLRTRLDEIGLFSRRGVDTSIIKRCLTAHSLDELFTGVLERLEDEFGMDRVRRPLSLLWASRHGLRAEDVEEIASESRIVLEHLEHYLMRDRHGVYRFLHGHFRSAIEARYLGHEDEARMMHRRLAAYYEKKSLTSNIAETVAWHLAEARDWHGLKEWLIRLDVLSVMFREGERHTLQYHWRNLDSYYDAGKEYGNSLDSYEEMSPSPIELAENLYQVALFLWHGHRGDSVIDGFARRALAVRLEHLGEMHRDTGISYMLLGMILRSQWKLEEAERMYRQALPIMRSCMGEQHPEVIGLLSSLAALITSTGQHERIDEARQFAHHAITMSEQHVGPEHFSTAWCYNVMAWVLNASGDLESAEAYLRKSLAIYERMFGAEHPHTAREYFHLAVFLDEKGDHKGAHALFRTVLALRERLLGPEHLEVATTLQVFGFSLLRRDELEESESHLCRSLEIAERRLGSGHPHTIVTLGNLIELMRRRWDPVRAEYYLIQLLRAQERYAGPGHSDTILPVRVAALHRLGIEPLETSGLPALLVPILESEDEDKRVHCQSLALETVPSARAFPIMCTTYISAFFGKESIGGLLDHMVNLFQAALGPEHHDTLQVIAITTETKLMESIG